MGVVFACCLRCWCWFKFYSTHSNWVDSCGAGSEQGVDLEFTFTPQVCPVRWLVRLLHGPE